MSEWRGVMNWPLDPNWECLVCGQKPLPPITSGLTWGFANGICRCSQCHATYSMKDSDAEKTIQTVPITTLKPEYLEAFKTLWEEKKTPFSEMTDEIWDLILPIKPSEETTLIGYMSSEGKAIMKIPKEVSNGRNT